MTEVIFSFDTENFTSNRGADGIFNEAELLREEGVKGCFCITGLLAEQLKNWKRDDVLKALKHHELSLHTYGHSLHPVIDEYTDIENYEEALAEFLKQETKAEQMVKSTLGVEKLATTCPPGAQKSYVMLYGYADMGYPSFASSYAPEDGTEAYYCNICQLYYSHCLECYLFDAEKEDLVKLLDDIADKKRVIFYTHPDMSIYTTHWDIVNYNGVNKNPFGEWEFPPEREKMVQEKFLSNFRTLIQLIKADSRFKFTTYSEITEKLNSEGERKITRDNITAIRKSLKENFAPLNEPCSLSVADVFGAVVNFLKGGKEYTCGKVYGFLSEPYAVKETVTVSAEDVIKAAEVLKWNKFLPTEFMVGNTKIGPADFLFAAMDVICGEKEIVVKPKNQISNLDILPFVRDKVFESKWLHGPDFKDEFLSDRLYYQAWTLRVPNIKK